MKHADRGGAAGPGGSRLRGTPGPVAEPLELDTYKHLIHAFIHRGFRAIAHPEKGQKTKC